MQSKRTGRDRCASCESYIFIHFLQDCRDLGWIKRQNAELSKHELSVKFLCIQHPSFPSSSIILRLSRNNSPAAVLQSTIDDAADHCATSHSVDRVSSSNAVTCRVYRMQRVTILKHVIRHASPRLIHPALFHATCRAPIESAKEKPTTSDQKSNDEKQTLEFISFLYTLKHPVVKIVRFLHIGCSNL